MSGDDKRGDGDPRTERLAAALRANLLLRKRRARGLADSAAAGTGSGSDRAGADDPASDET